MTYARIFGWGTPQLKAVEEIIDELEKLYPDNASPEKTKEEVSRTPEETASIQAMLDWLDSQPQPKPISAEEAPANHREGKNKFVPDTEAPIDMLIHKYFSYSDAPLDEGTLQVMRTASEQSPSAAKYGESLRDILRNTESRKAVTSMMEACDKTLDQLNIIPSPFAKSNSWVWWDMAKQNYYFQTYLKNPNEIETGGYTVGTWQGKQNEIVNRHVGWEVYRAFRTGEDNGLLNKLASHEQVEHIRTLLMKSPKENGTLSSNELAELGELLKSAVGIGPLSQ